MASSTDIAAKPKLVVIRGNSGSGKSSVGRLLQRRYDRSCALIEQDHLRRIVLRERDVEGGLAPQLVEHVARFALDHGRHVVLEGILAAARYRSMISNLVRDHKGAAYVFYLDVPLEETLRRHAQRPQASEFTGQDMCAWYLPRDVLGMDCERVIGPLPTLEALEDLIARHAGFPSRGAAQTDVPFA
jgi:predicted kinase